MYDGSLIIRKEYSDIVFMTQLGSVMIFYASNGNKFSIKVPT